MSYTRSAPRVCHLWSVLPVDWSISDQPHFWTWPLEAVAMSQPPVRGLFVALACGLATAVIVVYLPALWCDFIYDDYLVVHARPVPAGWGDWVSVFTTRQAGNLPYYRPLTWLTIDIQNALHGHWAIGFHAVNVLLGACWAVSVFWLLLSPGLRLSWLAAATGALVAAWHPVSACVIYPVSSGRETLLAAVAITLALAAWLRSGPLDTRRWPQPMWCLAWLLAGVGLLCREQAVVVPVLFVWADCLGLPGRRPGSLKAWAGRHAPLAVVMGGYLAIRWSLFGGSGEHHLAVWDYPLGPLQSVGYTLQTLVAPGWSLVYEPDLSLWWHPLRGPVSVVVLGAVSWAGGMWWWRRGDRGGVGGVLLFWLGWFLLVIAPTANLVGQQTGLAERYGFLATVPLAALLGAVVGEASQWGLGSSRLVRRGVSLLVVCGLCGLASVGWSRGTAYRSQLGFLEQWVAEVPTSAQAHLSLAGVLLESGDDVRAERCLDRALGLEPDYSEAHDGKGRILFHRGELSAAEASFRRAIDSKPTSAVSWNHLGYVIERQGRLDEAAGPCSWALKLDPRLVEAHNNLGMIRAQQGRLQAASGHFEQAVAISPDYAEAWTNLGLVYRDQGRMIQAAAAWSRALAADPGFQAARRQLERLERGSVGEGTGR